MLLPDTSQALNELGQHERDTKGLQQKHVKTSMLRQVDSELQD